METLVCPRCKGKLFSYELDKDYTFCLLDGLQYVGLPPLEKSHAEPHRRYTTKKVTESSRRQ